MTDRKYRQRGYQDTGGAGRSERRPETPRRPPEPRDPRMPRDPRVPNMPGFREVFRCARCGHLQSAEIAAETRCAKCGIDLHACLHCVSFDAGARFECTQAVAARISPKDARNSCALFAPRASIERETGSTPASASGGARRAFDDLFKF